MQLALAVYFRRKVENHVMLDRKSAPPFVLPDVLPEMLAEDRESQQKRIIRAAFIVN